MLYQEKSGNPGYARLGSIVIDVVLVLVVGRDVADGLVFVVVVGRIVVVRVGVAVTVLRALL
jgi:hypothetical protein